LSEVVRHSRGVAERFAEATKIEYRCECAACRRVLRSPNCGYWFRSADPLTDIALQPWRVAIAALESEGPTIVAKMPPP